MKQKEHLKGGNLFVVHKTIYCIDPFTNLFYANTVQESQLNVIQSRKPNTIRVPSQFSHAKANCWILQILIK